MALAGLGLAVVNALSNSPWGTFTIAVTIPIALFMGIYLYRIRPGKISKMSVIGVILLLLAVFFGRYVLGSFLDQFFNLSKNSLVLSITVYGFIASALPVWLLLAPRDYLSTYMKIGTILLLAVGVVVIAPDIQMPPVTRFAGGEVLSYRESCFPLCSLRSPAAPYPGFIH